MKLEFTIFTMRSWGWWKWWVFGWWQLWDSVRMWGFARLWIDATPAECRISWNGVKWILACCISTLVYIYIFFFPPFFFHLLIIHMVQVFCKVSCEWFQTWFGSPSSLLTQIWACCKLRLWSSSCISAFSASALCSPQPWGRDRFEIGLFIYLLFFLKSS